MIRKYIVCTRNEWTEGMKSLFGECGLVHALSDDFVVDAMIRFGRAEITLLGERDETELFQIEFQNDYD